MILAKPYNNTWEIESFLDATTILTYRVASRENRNLKVTCEMISENNLRFLYDEEGVKPSDPLYMLSIAASGNVVNGSLLDSLLCQSFFNPFIITVVSKLVSGTSQKQDLDDKEWNKEFLEYLGGSISPPTTVLGGSDVSGGSDMIKGSTLSLSPIPPQCLEARMTYGDMLTYMIDNFQSVTLGLMRGVQEENGFGNSLGYVYTNPDKNAILRPCDSIFVLNTKGIASHVIGATGDKSENVIKVMTVQQTIR